MMNNYKAIADHMIKKGLGKSVTYYNMPAQMLSAQATQAFNQLKKYTKAETIHLIHRKLERPPPGKRRTKYWEDTIRHYDQKQIGFFVCHVLAKRKVAIPLR